MSDDIKNQDQDTEGHWDFKATEEDDVEGHGPGGGNMRGATDDDDVEGHGPGGGNMRGATDDDDVEGHWEHPKATDDDDVEGHGATSLS